MNPYYEKIKTILNRLEQGKYTPYNVSWCIARIDWAWKWRKITKEQMDELAGRCCALLDTELRQIVEKESKHGN